jgi:hypothetical protein
VMLNPDPSGAPAYLSRDTMEEALCERLGKSGLSMSGPNQTGITYLASCFVRCEEESKNTSRPDVKGVLSDLSDLLVNYSVTVITVGPELFALDA